MQPLNVSPETAKKLAERLNMPIEHVLHMPRHILLDKLAGLAREEREAGTAEQGRSAQGEAKPHE